MKSKLQQQNKKEFKETELGLLPKDWRIIKLNESGKIITGNTPSKKIEKYWDNGTIWFIKPPNIKNSDINSFSEMISEVARKKARTVGKGSVLVTCIGEIGRVGFTIGEVSFNQQINAIIPNISINGKFLFYNLMTTKERLKEWSSSTTIPNLNKSSFSQEDLNNLPPELRQAIQNAK